jgi:hypothetical protein
MRFAYPGYALGPERFGAGTEGPGVANPSVRFPCVDSRFEAQPFAGFQSADGTVLTIHGTPKRSTSAP